MRRFISRQLDQQPKRRLLNLFCECRHKDEVRSSTGRLFHIAGPDVAVSSNDRSPCTRHESRCLPTALTPADKIMSQHQRRLCSRYQLESLSPVHTCDFAVFGDCSVDRALQGSTDLRAKFRRGTGQRDARHKWERRDFGDYNERGVKGTERLNNYA